MADRSPPFRIEPLDDNHDRTAFACGVPALDRYLREQISQDIRRRVANCFVAVDIATGAIAGYYTLAATGVALAELAPALVKKLPRYPVIPAALLGRLAVSVDYKGRGLGTALMVDAIRRVARGDLAVFALFVDAKDEAARTFYERHGFELLPGEPRRLCLPIATALKIIENE
ncbi:MAG: GNAT family N-acetyltransferase [Hyphomicrobiaceae bacterium]|nr:GNAT family N-acetyltransferase [Hyphomicrobiaceae bacterium]